MHLEASWEADARQTSARTLLADGSLKTPRTSQRRQRLSRGAPGKRSDRGKFFLDHQEIPIPFDGKISLLIAVEVDASVAGFVGAGKIVEVKSAGFQFVVADLVLPGGIHAHQDPSVLAKNVVDESDVTDFITVQAIVKCDAARV